MLKARENFLPFIVIISPVVVYLVYAMSFSGTLFFADDFHLLKTVVWMQETESIAEKLKLLIQQHNEHRIVIPRLITWLDYRLEGAIHWRSLILLGNLLWVSVLWFFWKGFKTIGVSTWFFVPVPFIFLQPQYFDNVNWSISIMQQSVIVFWYGLFCYLCALRKFRSALLVAIIATFTHGNGIFSFLLGILFLALDRNWRQMAIWAVVLVITGTIYFWGFQKGQNANFQESLADPVRLIMAFFAFFGSLSKVQLTNTSFAVLFGAVFIAVLGVYLLPKLMQYFRNKRELSLLDRQILGNVVFLGITAALVCVSRSWGGVDNVLAPRYQHYSPFVACWVYIAVLSLSGAALRKWIAGGMTVVALVYNGLCYFVYHEDVVLRYDWLTADTYNWENHDTFLEYASAFSRNIREPYNSALKRGICAPEPVHFPIARDTISVADNLQLTLSKRVAEERDAGNVYRRDVLVIQNEQLAGKSFIFLQQTGQTGYWIPVRRRNAGIRRLIGKQEVYQPGFEAEVMTENLKPGAYHLAVLNRGKIVWTKSHFSVPAVADEPGILAK